MRHKSQIMLLFACMPLIIIAIRHDLSAWRFKNGYTLFKHGDMNGALSSWSLISGNKRAAYNRGVAHLRKGDVDNASREFKDASESSDPHLRQRSLYNMGTVMLQSATKLAANDRDKSRNDLETIVAVLQTASRLDPNDADARHNDTIASNYLAELNKRMLSRQKKEKGSAEQSRKDKAEQTEGMKQGEQAKKFGKASDKGEGKGNSRPAPRMTHEDANRLLNEARGRELLRSSVAAKSSPASASPTEKDW